MGQHISKSGSKSGVKRYKGGGLNPSDILGTRDMIVERGNQEKEVDEVLTVSRDMLDQYPEASLQQLLLAQLKPNSQALAYYDGSNVAINEAYFNPAMESAYQECVKLGFHPGSGSFTGLQAVAAHEFGHAINDAAARKLGLSLDQAADRIVAEARQGTKHRGVVQMAAAISTYATASNAEAVAEAVCDVYCNGSKAKAESQAIVKTLKKYL